MSAKKKKNSLKKPEITPQKPPEHGRPPEHPKGVVAVASPQQRVESKAGDKKETKETKAVAPGAPAAAAPPSTQALSALLDSLVAATDKKDAAAKHEALRALVLTDKGLDVGSEQATALRNKLWLHFLDVKKLDANAYLDLVAKGPGTHAEGIKNDAPRTFTGEFTQHASLIRVLNAFEHKNQGRFFYVQGLNLLAGVLLQTLPELEAFHCFNSLVVKRMPLYWQSSCIGVTAGCALAAEVIAAVDPELSQALGTQTQLPGLFHAVSSLCASIGPLAETTKLFDYLLCFGPHLSVLCVAAQLILMRTQLLSKRKQIATTIMDPRKFPRLNAKKTIALATLLAGQIGQELLTRLRQHATDHDMCQQIVGRRVESAPADPEPEEELHEDS